LEAAPLRPSPEKIIKPLVVSRYVAFRGACSSRSFCEPWVQELLRRPRATPKDATSPRLSNNRARQATLRGVGLTSIRQAIS
jgi:hypothetical protein